MGFITMKHKKPPFGIILFACSKHLKQVQDQGQYYGCMIFRLFNPCKMNIGDDTSTYGISIMMALFLLH